MSLLGAAAQGNWLERLDADSASAVRRIRAIEIGDTTLFISVD